jgi:hypothetical protein
MEDTPIGMEDTPILFFSSLFFITNMITAYWFEYYLYSFLFCMLTITSVIYHTNKNIYTNIIDKIAILAIVLYGAYILYHKKVLLTKTQIGIVVLSFLLCIFMFFYGYCTNKYCYDPDKGDQYHSLLHLISSIGHHLIIFL